MLRRLSSHEGAARLRTRPCDGADDGGVAFGPEGPDRQVVHEGDRPRPGGCEVVGAHRDEVESDTGPPVRPPGQVELRAHTVGGEHEDGTPVPGRELDAGGEPAESAHHGGTPGGGDERLDAADVPVGRVEVDSGVSVGHGTVAVGSRENFPEASRTSVGYSPERQAWQNPPSPPAAARSPSSDR